MSLTTGYDSRFCLKCQTHNSMKQTITLSAPRLSVLPQLRNAVSKLSARIFSGWISTAVVAIGSAAAFAAAIAEQPRTCAAIVALTLPWFIKGLKTMEGGMR